MNIDNTARDNAIARMYMDGVTTVELSRITGVSWQRLSAILIGRGLTKKYGGLYVASTAKNRRKELLRDRQHFSRWGCSRRLLKELLSIHPNRNLTPIGYFTTQRQNARTRGIEWRLSFGEWWRIWQESGKWDDRGRGHGKYCMARHLDLGAYEVSNIKIILAVENNREWRDNHKIRAAKFNGLTPEWAFHK